VDSDLKGLSGPVPSWIAFPKLEAIRSPGKPTESQHNKAMFYDKQIAKAPLMIGKARYFLGVNFREGEDSLNSCVGMK
jgi:hypothetical protein